MKRFKYDELNERQQSQVRAMFYMDKEPTSISRERFIYELGLSGDVLSRRLGPEETRIILNPNVRWDKKLGKCVDK